MTYKVLTFLILFAISNSINGQTFSESYLHFFKKTWETEPTEEMKSQIDSTIDNLYKETTGKGFWENQAEQMEWTTLINIENFKSALMTMKIDIDKKDKLIIIEETSSGGDWPPNLTRDGFVFIDTKTYSYSFDSNRSPKYLLTTDFLDTNYIHFKSRKIIVDLVTTHDFTGLLELAKKETEYEPINPKVQYEIIIYDKYADEPLQIIYLHDRITRF